MHLTGKPLIECHEVALGYGAVSVLQHVNVALHQGAYVGVVGPNGAGKTTLLKALTGILQPRAGRVSIARDDSGRLPRFGYVAQSSALDSGYPVSALDVVLMGRAWRVGAFGRYNAADRAAALDALERVGMARRANWTYGELSPGQQQRVLLARALAGEPDILCLDEPTNFLDPDAQVAFMDSVGELCSTQGMTVLIVTHLLQAVVNHADSVWLVHGGRVRGLQERSEVERELARVLQGAADPRTEAWSV